MPSTDEVRLPPPSLLLPPSLPPGLRHSGSRLAAAALVIAFVGVLGGIYAADRALARADATARELAALRRATVGAVGAGRGGAAAAAALPGDAPPEPAAPGNARLRLVIWALGLTALSAVAIGLAHERRLRLRIAERSAELERLSGELIRVNRVKSEFLANVSHELRTPLNAIVGFVDLLQEGVYGELPPRQVAPVHRIAGSATHLRHLVDQILDLAKIAAGRLEVHTEPVVLRGFVFDVAAELEPLVHEKGLVLSLAVPATLPTLHTDPTHLRQILVNLLGNAVKFTPAGRVTVRAAVAPHPPELDRTESDASSPAESPILTGPARRPGRFAIRFPTRLGTGLLGATRRRPAVSAPASPEARWIALQVVDTGIGIPAQEHARIFDEFEQVGPRTGDGAVRGTGLGLAISRRLARLLGGDLTLASAPGQGSTFTLWLRAGVHPAGAGEG